MQFVRQVARGAAPQGEHLTKKFLGGMQRLKRGMQGKKFVSGGIS
jgi:hypothetical protein